MSNLIQPRVLKGFRDFLPDTELERRKIQHILENVFLSFGFLPIDTPILEYAEVLLGKGGGETDKQVYRFLDHGNRDVAMRFDLTVPFARFIAEHRNELYLPFKRYHIGKVFRGENTQRGRYREFTQCDFDIVGPDTASADFEILMLMETALEALSVTRFKIHLSNRAVFNRFLSHLEVREQSVPILRAVDKLQKSGRDMVIELLEELTDARRAGMILDYITPENDFKTTLEKMTSLAGGAAADTERLTDMHEYMETLAIEEHFILDPSITRGLDYYTGVVFETFLTDLPAIGSVCSGGRYNNLASLYTNEELPGVGSSIGLDRLMAALESLKKGKPEPLTHHVIILCMDKSYTGRYHELARRFRNEGITAEVFPEDKKIAAQFNFAEKKKIPFAVICGEDEFKSETITIKQLLTRENHEKISFSRAIGIVKSAVT